MDCCSSSQAVSESSADIDQAADQLAVLLAQAPEYREFVRLAGLIHLDPDVRRISIEIRNYQTLGHNTPDGPVEALQAELESLPAVQAFRRAQAAAKDLFHSVDQVISAEAGVVFAPNAVKSGCG